MKKKFKEELRKIYIINPHPRVMGKKSFLSAICDAGRRAEKKVSGHVFLKQKKGEYDRLSTVILFYTSSF